MRVSSGLGRAIDFYVRRRYPGSRLGRRIADRYIRAYDNNDVNMKSNGEFWLIRNTPKNTADGIPLAFDVGANNGEWSQEFIRQHRNCYVHAFEPVPAVYERLTRNVVSSNVQANNIGLSDVIGEHEILHTEDDTYYSSIVDHPQMNSWLNKRRTRVMFTTGDAYCQAQSIEAINLLKIDVEGHDLRVLQGFRKMLEAEAIDVIQFEYNYTAIFARTALFDYYELLSPWYEIGRLLADSVELVEYNHVLDDFRQANFVAIRRSGLRNNELAYLCRNWER